MQQLQPKSTLVNSALNSEPIVLCAADNNYVQPLTVTLQSAAQNIRAGYHLRAIVLDGGISKLNWAGLKESMADLPIDLFAIKPDIDAVSDLSVSHHVTHTAYLRLLAGRLLPPSIDKVIYLDSDLLVRGDLVELWETSLENLYALAVPDIACPYVDSRHAECNFARSSPYMATISPIPNWRQLGIAPDALYFNSGVMVLNIRRMREDHVEHRLLSCLKENEQHVWCWDQYALNVVFSGQWKSLPLKWNQGAHVFEFPSNDCSPLDESEFVEAKNNPAIVHFTTEWKPWRYGNTHPLKDSYFEQLDSTAWSGWRPEKPPFRIAQAWQDFATEFVKRWTIGYRKLAAVFHKPKRREADSRGVKNLPDLRAKETGEEWPANDCVRRLTIFAIPKAFRGDTDRIQRNAINSWKRLAPFADIVLLGDDEGVAAAASGLGVRHLPGIEINEHGTPKLSSAFAMVREYSDSDYFAYCNCDIILLQDFGAAIRRLLTNDQLQRFVATGRRVNIDLEETIDFDDWTQINQLVDKAQSEGQLESLMCKDFFVFPRTMFAAIPAFAVGRGNWDNWLVKEAKRQRVPVVNVSNSVLALHQQHGHAHVGSRWDCYVNGKEARANQAMGNGRHWISGSSFDFRLEPEALLPSRMKFIAGDFWMDFPRAVRLIGNLLRTSWPF